MRVSKETAVLLKDAGYDVPCNLVPNSCIVDDSGNILYLPTIHEAAGWLRGKGVHVGVDWDGVHWFWYIKVLDNSDSIVGGEFDTHDIAYEAGIVHGLKYIIH